jgi:membrane protease YdiL (CAAX protease family)
VTGQVPDSSRKAVPQKSLSADVESVAGAVAVSMLAILIGLRLGPRIGLGEAGLRFEPGYSASDWRRFNLPLTLAAGTGATYGIVSTVVLTLLEKAGVLGSAPEGLVAPPRWSAFLASAGAGIQEEIIFRLGAMTFLAWLGAKLIPGDRAVWVANVLAALLFGAAHLPQAILFLGVNAALISVVLLANGAAGVLCGWLYWRYGLLAAIVAHFAMDFVQKVVMTGD